MLGPGRIEWIMTAPGESICDESYPKQAKHLVDHNKKYEVDTAQKVLRELKEPTGGDFLKKSWEKS